MSASAAPTGRGDVVVRVGDLRRGRRVALAAGELRLPRGASVALAGANGAGKSTLLMAIAGVLAPGGGKAVAEFAGSPVARVGYVPQRPAFPAWLPLADVLRLHGAPPSALDVLAPLDRSTLLARAAGELSVGQTQALAAAIALHRDDPLVLLDEPFAGVDVARRLALHSLVAARRRRDPSAVIVLSSHVAADLDALCDWLVVLRDGRIAFTGPRSSLGAADTFARELAALTG